MSGNPALKDVFARALALARAYATAGTHEVGGNNEGDQVEFFQRVAGIGRGAPWCMAFVLTCLTKAYAQLMGLPEDRESLVGLVGRFCATYRLTRTGYCPTMWTACERLGLTRGPHVAVPANSLVMFDFEDQGEPHHVGFVATASGPDLIIGTIEGNTPDGQGGNPADGDGVFAKSHSRAKVFGFVVAG